MVRKAKIIRPKDRVIDKDHEPPIIACRAILSETVEDPHLTMTHAVIPPAGRNQRHYHINNDAGMYVLKGRLKMFLGPDHEMEEVIAEEGDFVFVPAGTIHGLMNLSETEQAELIAAKPGVSHKRDEGTVFVEPRWVK